MCDMLDLIPEKDGDELSDKVNSRKDIKVGVSLLWFQVSSLSKRRHIKDGDHADAELSGKDHLDGKGKHTHLFA